MAEEQQLPTEEPQPTAEAIKQREKREKAAAKDAALGVEKFTVEVAGVFKPDLKRVMATHGIWRGDWGFLVNGVKVPWRTYTGTDN